jgi:signal recognition particle subunit SEC65
MTEQALTVTPQEAEPITADAITAAAVYDPRAKEIEAAKRLWIEIETMVRQDKLDPDAELTEDDKRTIQDSFDGETKLDSLIEGLIGERIVQESYVPGLDKKIEDMKARKDRAKNRIGWINSLIDQAMVTAGWIGKDKTFRCALGTVNTRPATPTVEVLEESKVPSKFFKRPDPTLDKIELNKHVLGRYRAMDAALALRDQTEREQAIAKVQTDFGDEVPGVRVKIEGYTTTIKTS